MPRLSPNADFRPGGLLRPAWRIPVLCTAGLFALVAGCRDSGSPTDPTSPSSGPSTVPILTLDGISENPVDAAGPSNVSPGASATFSAPGYLARTTLVPSDGRVFLWPITVDESYVRTIVYETWSFSGTQRLFRWSKRLVGITPGVPAQALAEIASTGALTLNASAQPDIEVTVNPNDPDLDGYQGFASCNTVDYEIVHCRVVLRSAAVRASPVMTHELGHCLGLGHSPRAGDVMAPAQGHNARFTPHERVLVTMMYERRRPGNAPPDDDTALGPAARTKRTLKIGD